MTFCVAPETADKLHLSAVTRMCWVCLKVKKKKIQTKAVAVSTRKPVGQSWCSVSFDAFFLFSL